MDGVSVRTEGQRKPASAGAIRKARRFRKESTLAERTLWDALRERKLNIRRQVPMGRYVADFVSHAARLIIEIDGYYHSLPEVAAKDAERTKWLETQGYRVIRFAEQAAREDTWSVVDRIEVEIKSPSPSMGEGSGMGVQSRRRPASSPPTPTLPPSRGKGEMS